MWGFYESWGKVTVKKQESRTNVIKVDACRTLLSIVGLASERKNTAINGCVFELGDEARVSLGDARPCRSGH
jgi:hypothetical protein